MIEPATIAHWSDLEGPDDGGYEDSPERLSLRALLARNGGLTRLGIHHERLPPGRRTSYPHAESSQEEFVYVLEGTPDVWLDGHLHRLRPGQSVAFPAGTGLAHTFINDTETDVRLLVIGEASKPENRVHYPMNQPYEATRSDRWFDHPHRELGPHDGRPKKRL